MNLSPSNDYSTCFFKAFHVVVESFESLPAATLFCWLNNECEMSKLENENGKFIYRSQKDIINQFHSLGRRQVEQALTWLEQENLILRERKQYGFLIQIHPNANASIQSKWEHWQAEKDKKSGEKTPSQNAQNVHSEDVKSANENVHFEHSQAEFDPLFSPGKTTAQNVQNEHSDSRNVHSDSRNVHSDARNVHSAFLLYKEQRRTNVELSRTNSKVHPTSKIEEENSSPHQLSSDDPARFTSEPSCPLNAGGSYESLTQEGIDYPVYQEQDQEEAARFVDSLPDEWFQQEEEQRQKDIEAYQSAQESYPDYPVCPVEADTRERPTESEITESVFHESCRTSTESKIEERNTALPEEQIAPQSLQPVSAAREEKPEAISQLSLSSVADNEESFSSDSAPSEFPSSSSSSAETLSSELVEEPNPTISETAKVSSKKSTKKGSQSKSKKSAKKKSTSKRLSKTEKQALLESYAGMDDVLLNILQAWAEIRVGKRAVESAGAYQRQFSLINEYSKEAKVSRAAYVNYMVNKEWKGAYNLSNYAVKDCREEWKVYCRQHDLSYAETIEWSMPVDTPIWQYTSVTGLDDEILLQTPWYELQPSEKARVQYLEDHPAMLVYNGTPIPEDKLEQCRKRRWQPKPEPVYSGDDTLPF